MKHFFLVSIALCLIFRGSVIAQQGWTQQTSPVTSSLGKVQFVSSTEGWIATENGKLLHTTNAGSVWTFENPGPADSVEALTSPDISMGFISQLTGWLVGTLGGFENPQGTVIYRTNNGGSSWNRQVLSSYAYGFGIHFFDATNGWVLVATSLFPTINGSLLHTTTGGATWPPIFNATNTSLFVSFVDANNGWAAVDSLVFDPFSGEISYVPPFRIWRTTNAGANWTTQYTDNTPGGFEQIQFVDASNGWVVGDSGKILRTTNGGAEWLPVTNTGSSSSSKHRCLFFLDASHGWIGRDSPSASPVALHTTNGGATWTTQNTGVSFGAIFSINFVDQNTGWFTTDFGEIYHTTSGGEPTSVREEYQSNNPRDFRLEQNYPNPFNPTTTIRFALPKAGHVTLKVFNLLGKQIEALVDGERTTGIYTVEWKPENLSSGVYFYQLQTGDYTETKKLVLLR